MSKQVVHVHALGPALLVSNLGFVLQVNKHLGFARQDVEQAAAIGCGNFLGWPESNICLQIKNEQLVITTLWWLTNYLKYCLKQT